LLLIIVLTKGEYGRLGHGDNITQLRPKQVKALIGQRVVQVACGSRDAQTLALTDEGKGEEFSMET